MKKAEKIIKDLFTSAGVEFGGKNPWDIQVHNEEFYSRVLGQGSLGLGESYMDGWWDCEALDQFFYKILRAELDKKVKLLPSLFVSLKQFLVNMQSKTRSQRVICRHYDLGNELYMSFLDPYNQYTCGYFEETDELNKAQEKKMDLICKKLNLSPKDKVLDIGCGWGGFARFAAENYGCRVTGITISEEQLKYARKFCEGLPVEIKFQDYRDLGENDEKFSCVVSIGMVEHVGGKNYRTFMEKVYSVLNNDGVFLLHTIGVDNSKIVSDRWVNKYIFPNGRIPSIEEIGRSIKNIFVIEDWHNFGADYSKTLKAWYENFEKNWDQIKPNYDERFYRMWKYYLLSYSGAFRARKNQLWQIVLSKKGIVGGYRSIR